KIDAEGGELSVLRGARGCLAKFRPVVAFECGARSLAAYGAAPADLARLWAGLGYVVRGRDGEPLPEADLVRSIGEERNAGYGAARGEDARAGELVVGAVRGARRMAAVWGALSGAEELTAESLELPPTPHRRGPGRWLARAAG